MRKLREGIHADVPMSDYISDPCPLPSVSRGTLHTLITQSPLHARYHHPVLGDAPSSESSRADAGTAVHSLVLGGNEIAWLEFDDWRTKQARAVRDEIRASGRTPMLAKDRDDAEKAAEIAKIRLRSFGPGVAEQTMIWKDGNTWCRARPDWLSMDQNVIVDLKTTMNADPFAWAKSTMYSQGYDLQHAHYLRGLQVLTKNPELRFVFLVVEIEAPYACSVVSLSNEAVDYAERKRSEALARWADCYERDEWPGFQRGGEVHYADLPKYLSFEYDLKSAARMETL